MPSEFFHIPIVAEEMLAQKFNVFSYFLSGFLYLESLESLEHCLEVSKE